MSNIRSNFSEMSDIAQRQFFWTYADNREKDFQRSKLVVVKTKTKKSTTSTKEPKLILTPAQLQLLKTLGLV